MVHQWKVCHINHLAELNDQVLVIGVLHITCLACAEISKGTRETSVSLKLEVTGCVDLVLNDLLKSSVLKNLLLKQEKDTKYSWKHVIPILFCLNASDIKMAYSVNVGDMDGKDKTIDRK